MSIGIILIVAMTFLCVGLLGYLLSRSSVVFWGRYQEAFTEQARFNLSDMFMFMDPRSLWRVNAVAIIVIPILLWALFDNPVLALAAAVMIWLLPKRIYRWMHNRRLLKIREQLPDALMMAAGGMRAGLGFSPSLESLAHDVAPPLSQEFSLVLREQRMGVKPDDALVHFSERVPVQDVVLFVSAVSISREIGGNLAESLTALSETLRRKLIMEGRVRSLTAQGRLQGIAMASMPILLLLILCILYPDTMRPMFHTWLGYGVMAVIAVMDYLGYRMCRKLMSIDV